MDGLSKMSHPCGHHSIEGNTVAKLHVEGEYLIRVDILLPHRYILHTPSGFLLGLFENQITVKCFDDDDFEYSG